MNWTVQPDDLIGGWLVTTYPYPLSEHDLRKDGDPSKRGVIACDCTDKKYADLIANLLNSKNCGSCDQMRKENSRLTKALTENNKNYVEVVNENLELRRELEKIEPK